jgi:branched-chain amino acid transport system substrate-binding protein
VRIRAFVLIAIVAVLAAGCGVGPPDHVRIGVVAPQTGTRAWLGQDVVAGARMAADDLNAAGGLLGAPVELVVVDDAELTGLPGQLADLAERARVTAIIGPEAPGVLVGPRSPLTRRHVPALLPSAFGGDLTAASTFVGRTIPSARAQAERLGLWLRNQRETDRLAVLIADPVEGDLARDDLTAGFAAAGVTVDAVLVAPGDAADLRPAVTALRADAPTTPAVLLWGPPSTAARATLAMRDIGWDDVQIAVPASALVSEYRTLTDEASEGVVAAFPYDEAFFGGPVTRWMVRYHAREGIGLLPQLETLVVDLPVLAIASYDAVNVVAQAVQAVGSRVPADVADALATRSFQGLLSTYDFADREAWSADRLYVGRFHHLAITFDVDDRLDTAFQRDVVWRAQVSLDFLPDDILNGPLGALIQQAIGEHGPPPEYQAPLQPPGPVGRP